MARIEIPEGSATIRIKENKQEFVPEVGQIVKGSWGSYRNIEVEVSAYRGDKVWVTSCGRDEVMKINDIKFRPLKTEAVLKRESVVREMQKNVDFYNPDVEYVMFSLCDAGYIKPREVSKEDVARIYEYKIQGKILAANHLYVLAKEVEKHIKGEA